MTTNINSQGNQIHPAQDPNVDFHYTFEVFLPKGKSTVYIMKDHEAIGRIPTMAFWNSAKCSDSYYETQDLDISDPDDIERDEPEILPKQYHQIHVLDMNKPYRPTKEEINAEGKLSLSSKATKYRDGIDEHNIINEAGKSVYKIEGEAIPGLARDHKVQLTKYTDFDFPDLNFGVIDNCENPGKDKVLTAQAKDCPICPKIDLPSKACAYDKNEGKIKCSDFEDIRTIERSADSVYYMTVTRDKEKNYKFYFSDKDGNKTDDLELRLNDVKIKDPYLLRALESDCDIKKLSEKFERFVNKHSQEKENAELENFGNQRTADSNLGVFSTTIATDPELQKGVAEILATDEGFCKEVTGELTHPSKRDAVINKLMHDFIVNPERDVDESIPSKTLADIVKEKLADDVDFQENVKGNPGEKGEAGSDGPNTSQVADLLINQKASQLGRAVLNAIDNSGKKLSDEVTDTLKLDSSFKAEVRGALGRSGRDSTSGRDVNLSEVAAQLVTGSNLSTLSTAVASEPGLQTGVAGNLIGNSSFFDKVFKHEIVETLADDVEFQEDVADEIIHRKTLADIVKEKLATDEAFKNSVKGEKGPQGPRGDAGVQGASRQGVDSNLVAAELERSTNFQTEVANKLITTKAPELGRAVIDAEKSDTNRPISATVTRWAVDVLKGNADFQTDVANNPSLKRSVINSLRADQDFKDSVKGEKGPQGPAGVQGASGQNADPNSVATQLERSSNFQTKVANKLITTKASDLGRAVISADESDSQRSFSRYVKDWVETDLKSDSAFKTSIQGADGTSPTPQSVATELLTGRNNITQLGQAVLDVEKSDASGHPISNIVSQWVITNLEINNKTIKEYEEQVKQIGEDAKLEKEHIVEMERTITDKVKECEGHAESAKNAADDAEDYANSAKSSAEQAGVHARSSQTSANHSQDHAKISQKEAANAKNHADIAVTAAGKAGGHAQSSQIAADRSERHSINAQLSSEDTAAFASNVKEMACKMDPLLPKCQPNSSSSRSRREATWEEPEDQVPQYENSELIYSLTDSVSII